MFHHRPRYDFVIVHTIGGVIFGQLLYMFTCSVQGQTLPIALVLPFDAGTGRRSRKQEERDQELGLYRLRAKPRNTAEFFSIRSSVRGALLVDDHKSNADSNLPGTFKFVVDTVDSDMFLRVKGMRS